MLFKYRAFHRNGQCITGHMWAFDEKVVAEQLCLLHIKHTGIYRVMRVRRKLKITELIDFLLYLVWMLRAGVPLREAMHELTLSSQNGKQCHVALQIMHYMDSGLLLSQAMALLPSVFSPLAVYYTVVGEKSGNLILQLDLLVKGLQWQVKWQEKIVRVLAYPLFTLSVAIAALLYLLLEVVPALAALLSPLEAQQTLPILALSRLISCYGMYVMWLACGIFLLGYICVQHFPSCRYQWDAALLRLPAIGWLIRDMGLTRMVEVIAHLHGAGFTLLDCLHVAQDLVRNQALQKQIAHVAKAMEEGASLSNSFIQSAIFPPILLRALHLAEKSGHVAIALEHAAQFFRDQIVARMHLMEALLGPLCLLLVGGLLIGLVLSVFAPLFDVIGQVY